jgi:hypothetical protein
MGSYNFETSNVILMIYKQLVLFIGIVLLFLFGMDSARHYILPPQWRESSGSVRTNSAKSL